MDKDFIFLISILASCPSHLFFVVVVFFPHVILMISEEINGIKLKLILIQRLVFSCLPPNKTTHILWYVSVKCGLRNF